MSANLEGFDASQVDPSVPFTVVPKGEYVGVFNQSGFKENSKKTGEYLEMRSEIVEGEHRGQFLYSRLNLKNPNETAVKIAQAELSAICHAVGVIRPRDSADLHNKPLIFVVDVEERKDKPGSHSNVIKGYKPLSERGSAAASGTTQSTTHSATPPWKQRAAG